jgi:hypothetical protein
VFKVVTSWFHSKGGKLLRPTEVLQHNNKTVWKKISRLLLYQFVRYSKIPVHEHRQYLPSNLLLYFINEFDEFFLAFTYQTGVSNTTKINIHSSLQLLSKSHFPDVTMTRVTGDRSFLRTVDYRQRNAIKTERGGEHACRFYTTISTGANRVITRRKNAADSATNRSRIITVRWLFCLVYDNVQENWYIHQWMAPTFNSSKCDPFQFVCL